MTDERFAKREPRLKNRGALSALINETLKARPAGEWCSLLNAAGVPCGEVLTVPEAIALPQIVQRQIVAEFPGVVEGREPIRVLRTGFRLDGTPLSVSSPPPALGVHTKAILAELGYSEADEQRFKEEKAI